MTGKFIPRKFHKYGFAFVVTVIITVYYGWRVAVWARFPIEYDAGIHIILAKLWSAGYEPYREIFVSYPPVFMWSLGVPWKYFGGVDAVRLLMATYALAAVLTVIYVGTVYHSKQAGVLAGVVLAFIPAYFIPSFAIMTEIPSISIAVVAITCADVYRRRGGFAWTVLSGLLLAVSLSLKILSVYAIPLIATILLSRSMTGHNLRQINWRQAGRDIIGVSLGGIVGFFVPLLFYDWFNFYQQVLAMRFVSREAYNPLDSNNLAIIKFLAQNTSVSVWALYGLTFVLLPRWRKTWMLLLWIALVWMTMAFHVPLREKHLPIFLPVLSVFAGIGIADWLLHCGRLIKDGFNRQRVGLVVSGLLAMIFLIWQLPGAIMQNNAKFLTNTPNKQRETALEFIAKTSTPTDCVVADNPVFLYKSGHLPPPELSETSQTRIDTGYLTLSDVIASLNNHHCHIVSVVSPRFRSIQGLDEWLLEHYVGHLSLPETDVYFGKLNDPGSYQSASDTIEAQGLEFVGKAIYPPDIWRVGQPGYVSLVWHKINTLAPEYRRTVTLRRIDDPTPLVFVSDRPFLGLANLAKLPVGALARETVRLDVPPDILPGKYQLVLSVCIVTNGTCLDAVYAFLGNVTVR